MADERTCYFCHRSFTYNYRPVIIMKTDGSNFSAPMCAACDSKVAQPVEHPAVNGTVLGSSPSLGANLCGLEGKDLQMNCPCPLWPDCQKTGGVFE